MLRIIGIILVCLLGFSACQNGRRNDVDVSSSVKVFRYDRLQYEATVMNSVSALQRMRIECPQLTKLLIEDVLQIGSVSEPDINDRLCAYYSDTLLVRLMNDVGEAYRDLSDVEKALDEGFGNLKRELPSMPVPQVYSQISALNQSVIVGDSLLAFSLDKYMGKDYPLYRRYYHPHQRRSMERARIVPDCLTFYLLSFSPFPWEDGHRTLFDIMMYRGKIAWIVEQALQGNHSGQLTLGYAQSDVDWCRKHCAKLWKQLGDTGLLDSTDPKVIRQYIALSDLTMFEGDTLPPNVGVWMGVQLVDKFMKGHPSVGIDSLLNQTDFSEMLSASAF